MSRTLLLPGVLLTPLKTCQKSPFCSNVNISVPSTIRVAPLTTFEPAAWNRRPLLRNSNPTTLGTTVCARLVPLSGMNVSKESGSLLTIVNPLVNTPSVVGAKLMVTVFFSPVLSVPVPTPA